MTIASATVYQDGTASNSGGTSKTMTSMGPGENVQSVYFDGTDFSDRFVCTFTTKQPKVSSSSPNGYTQGRAKFVLKVPMAAPTDGDASVSTFSGEFAFDRNLSSSDKDRILAYVAQIIYGSDFTDFWKSLSVS
jgi:hypothetical protein